MSARAPSRRRIGSCRRRPLRLFFSKRPPQSLLRRVRSKLRLSRQDWQGSCPCSVSCIVRHMRKPHILIAGGGIGGLTAALALLRRGFDVDVYEQAPELKEVGAGVQISANGTRTLHALGLEAAVERVSWVPQAKEIRLW